MAGAGEVQVVAVYGTGKYFGFPPNTYEPPLNLETVAPQITNANGLGYGPLASDASGTNLIAMQLYEGFWTSNDSGQSWTFHAALDANGSNAALNWNGVASSADGQVLFAASKDDGDNADPAGLFVSSDFGNEWVNISPRVDDLWSSVAMTSTGMFLYATNQAVNGEFSSGGDIFNYNAAAGQWTNETQNTGPSDRTWTGIASDATGEHRVAIEIGTRDPDTGVYSGGDIWTSTSPESVSGTYGPWINQTQNGAAHGFVWESVTSDDTGKYLAATAYGSGVWTSSDYGVTWALSGGLTPYFDGQPGNPLTNVASDGSGAILVAGVYAGDLFTSKDYGATWVNTSPINGNMAWNYVAISKDGTVGLGGTAYTLVTLGDAPATFSYALTGASGATLTLLYVGNGQFYVLDATGEWLESKQ